MSRIYTLTCHDTDLRKDVSVEITIDGYDLHNKLLRQGLEHAIDLLHGRIDYALKEKVVKDNKPLPLP